MNDIGRSTTRIPRFKIAAETLATALGIRFRLTGSNNDMKEATEVLAAIPPAWGCENEAVRCVYTGSVTELAKAAQEMQQEDNKGSTIEYDVALARMCFDLGLIEKSVVMLERWYKREPMDWLDATRLKMMATLATCYSTTDREKEAIHIGKECLAKIGPIRELKRKYP
jgi:hypothetical protein